VNVDTEIEDFLRPLFGDMAPITVETQKEKLGLGGDLNAEDYKKVADEIRRMCEDMAGEIIASKIYKGLLSLIEGHDTG